MIVEITLKLWKDETNSLAIEHVVIVSEFDMKALQAKLTTKISDSITSLPTALAALEGMIAKEEAGNTTEAEFDVKYGNLSDLIAGSIDPKTLN